MPSGAIEYHDRMTVRHDVAFDVGQVQVHGFGIGLGQASATAARRTDSAEQISPIVTLVARCWRPAAALRQDAGQRALLTDTGFVLPPDLDRLAACVRRNTAGNQIGEVFLNASCAAMCLCG